MTANEPVHSVISLQKIGKTVFFEYLNVKQQQVNIENPSGDLKFVDGSIRLSVCELVATEGGNRTPACLHAPRVEV